MGLNLANELVARGLKVDLVLMRATGDLLPLLSPDVRIIELGAERLRDVFRPLSRYLRRTGPRSMLACMWPLTCLAVAARAASNARTRMVVAEHATWSAAEERASIIHRVMIATSMRLFFPWANEVVAVSAGAANDLSQLARLPPGRIHAIPNPVVGGVNVPRRGDGFDARQWLDGDHRRILAVGRLSVIKDYPTMLRAFAILRRRVDARLLILGEGEARTEVEQLIIELGLEMDVFAPGFSLDPDCYYQVADLHVLSSRSEGFGNVIVEALQHGVPVVSTDCPSGPREILQDGRYGALVPVADQERMASAMYDALHDAHDTDALKARAREYSVASAADAYLDLLLPDWRQQARIGRRACT